MAHKVRNTLDFMDDSWILYLQNLWILKNKWETYEIRIVTLLGDLLWYVYYHSIYCYYLNIGFGCFSLSLCSFLPSLHPSIFILCSHVNQRSCSSAAFKGLFLDLSVIHACLDRFSVNCEEKFARNGATACIYRLPFFSSCSLDSSFFWFGNQMKRVPLF